MRRRESPCRTRSTSTRCTPASRSSARLFRNALRPGWRLLVGLMNSITVTSCPPASRMRMNRSTTGSTSSTSLYGASITRPPSPSRGSAVDGVNTRTSGPMTRSGSSSDSTATAALPPSPPAPAAASHSTPGVPPRLATCARCAVRLEGRVHARQRARHTEAPHCVRSIITILLAAECVRTLRLCRRRLAAVRRPNPRRPAGTTRRTSRSRPPGVFRRLRGVGRGADSCGGRSRSRGRPAG